MSIRASNKRWIAALSAALMVCVCASASAQNYSLGDEADEVATIQTALYQQDLKLQRAKELLSTTDLFVKEIAYMLNFDSPDYFSSKFKRKTGLKPSDFRNIDRK